MSEATKTTFAGIVYPLLLSIIGFFLVQTYNELKEIQGTLNAFLIESSSVNTRVKKNESAILYLDEKIKKLDDYNKERDVWVRDWLEKYQPLIGKK